MPTSVWCAVICCTIRQTKLPREHVKSQAAPPNRYGSQYCHQKDCDHAPRTRKLFPQPARRPTKSEGTAKKYPPTKHERERLPNQTRAISIHCSFLRVNTIVKQLFCLNRLGTAANHLNQRHFPKRATTGPIHPEGGLRHRLAINRNVKMRIHEPTFQEFLLSRERHSGRLANGR